MRQSTIPLIRAVLLFGALTLGSIDPTHAASHHEAPLIDIDNKPDINNVFINPKLPPTTPPGNQVSIGFNGTTNQTSVSGQEPHNTQTSTGTTKFYFTTNEKEQADLSKQFNFVTSVLATDTQTSATKNGQQVNTSDTKLESISDLQPTYSTLKLGGKDSQGEQTSIHQQEGNPSANPTDQLLNSGKFDVPSVDSLSIQVEDKEFLVLYPPNSQDNGVGKGTEGPVRTTVPTNPSSNPGSTGNSALLSTIENAVLTPVFESPRAGLKKDEEVRFQVGHIPSVSNNIGEGEERPVRTTPPSNYEDFNLEGYTAPNASVNASMTCFRGDCNPPYRVAKQSEVSDGIGKGKEEPLRISQFFSAIQTDQAKALKGFQAGNVINMIVEGTKGISDSKVSMSLISADSAETVQASGTLSENVGAGIWGNRRVASFTMPNNLSRGFYDFNLEIGSQLTQPVQIQITDSSVLNRRQELVQIILAAIQDKYAYPYALVGPYSPLPLGAKVHDPNTGELITTIDQDNTWLFFAYDPDAFFGQSDARWILINGNSEDMQIIEHREFWPEVVTADGEAYPFDFGSHDHVYYGLFNAGPYFQDHNTGEDTTPEKKDETDSTEEDSDSIGPAIIGLSSTLKDCPPEEIKKYAFILTFDDTDKRFIELKNDEKKLLKKLGISAANITELDPKDFLTDKKTFEIDPKTWNKSFATFRSKLEALLKTIDDCCAEVLIIVNSHANKDGMLKFKKAKDMKNWIPVPKGNETIEVKPKDKAVKNAGKPGRGMKNNFSSGFLTQMIAETFKNMDKSCIPVALINHSCYSGIFESTSQNLTANRKAITTHPNIQVYASSSSDEKSYGRVNGTSYQFPFIDAIAHCLSKAESVEKRTLAAQWDCIVKETKKRAKTIDGLQTPTKYPK